jgi:hypothetical protein
MNQGYDLIGDIHGHANDLIALLRKMGYDDSSGYFQHSERKIVFLGDFIDRGINQKKVLNIVMPMIDSGSAYAVMGNHEFNALSFHTKDPENPTVWLRKRDNKNIHQHLAFLQDYSSPKSRKGLDRVLSFFMSLPLWLELDGLRVVHACWDDELIKSVRPLLSKDHTLSKDFLIAANKNDGIELRTIETLLKGVERELPSGVSFLDTDGIERTNVRIRWWMNNATHLGELAFGLHDENVKKLPVGQNDLMGYSGDAEPVFIGHYWLEGEPKLLTPNAACLDYSVAKKNGKLVAYRWDGEKILSEDKFVFYSGSWIGSKKKE